MTAAGVARISAHGHATTSTASAGYAATFAAAFSVGLGKPGAGVLVTGQTAVDAVREVAGRTPLRSEWQAKLDAGQGLVTVTMHRRENLPMMADMAQALADVARAHPELHFIYPVHLNPAVQDAVRPWLSDLSNFELTEPLDYAGWPR